MYLNTNTAYILDVVSMSIVSILYVSAFTQMYKKVFVSYKCLPKQWVQAVVEAG